MQMNINRHPVLITQKDALDRKAQLIDPVAVREEFARRISEYARRVAGELGLSLEEIRSPCLPAKKTILCVGRIVSAEDTDGVFLETSYNFGDCLAKLDLSATDGYSLFPGKLVAAYGEAVDGEVFKVSSFYETKPAGGVGNCHASILFIVGPFFDGHSHSNPRRVIWGEEEKDADLVVLIGPGLSTGQMLCREVFSSFRKEPEIIVIPSLEDKSAAFVYPQPAGHSLPGLLSYPNPVVFSYQGISVGVSSVDLLTVLEGGLSKNRPLSVARHFHDILEQRSFCAPFPSSDIPFDYTGSRFLEIDCGLDLLIIPSTKESKEEIIGKTLCLNPPFSTKTRLSKFMVSFSGSKATIA
eukprot:GHVN01100608.1.p4 GENE.GHVN01100608.1~~GHVN01100608.1.p4  ORF type:complete len:355 (-),score=24.66 GHVN01100608.1:2643-3707(-)